MQTTTEYGKYSQADINYRNNMWIRELKKSATRANKYNYEEAIKSKLIAEKVDLTDTESCKKILWKCVMWTKLIKQYDLIINKVI